MKSRILTKVTILFALLFLAGCTTVPLTPISQEGKLSHLDVSAYPSNVYVGLSGPYSTKEIMVEQAIINCARNVLIKDAIALDSALVLQWSSFRGLQSFASDEKAYYDDSKLAETINALEILDIHFDPDAGAVVIARNNLEDSEKRAYTTLMDSNGKPEWLSKYPKVSGYRFGIGSTKPYYFLNKTLETADFLAAQNLLDLNTEHAFSIEKVQTVGDMMERSLYQAQKGLLQGFSILARFYDEATDTYWSLASCKEE